MFSWRNKKNINTFGLKKSALSKATCMYTMYKQTIHMKCQDLFSMKNKKKKLLSAAVVIGTLRAKSMSTIILGVHVLEF